MQYTDHDYGDTAAEFAELRELLIESYAIAGRPGNWLHSRLEDWKYGGNSQRPARFFLENARVWRDQAGRLAGACICEYGGDGVYLQVHPEHQSVEAAMLDWAVTIWGAGRPRVETYAYEHDEQRQRRLRERGFECFRRLQARGIRQAYIASGTEPAVGNRLYESLGPTEKLREDSWVKRLG